MFRHLLSPRLFVQRCNNVKSFCTLKTPLVIELLKSRSVVKVSGDETPQFMQGIITNDMKHLEEGACSMFTMFLNTKGRVMYDAIIYQTPNKDAFLVECDLAALPALKKHLTLYRVRRKINIESLEDEMNVWVLYDPTIAETHSNHHHERSIAADVTPEVIVPCASLDEMKSSLSASVPKFNKEHNLTVCRDPRVPALGFRILAPKNKDMNKIAADEIGAKLSSKVGQYKAIRYKLGVGEGVDELPPGNCFPLEANCDYLHGVSFHKGCYIGQELTARTHHTGVVRKRLMPVEFDAIPTMAISPDTPIHLGNSCSRPVGKLRGAEEKTGLALLRIVEALESPGMKVLDVKCQTMKPFWWPQEASKDRIIAGNDSSSV